MGLIDLGSGGICEQTDVLITSTATKRYKPGRIMTFLQNLSSSGVSFGFVEADGGIRDDGFRPETYAEDASERYVQKCNAGAETEVVSDPANNEGDDGTAHDPSAQNTGERPMVLGNRVQRERDKYRPHH